MDVAIVAQIITGIATFIVAIVLVFQLTKQNQQLQMQHRDSIKKLIIKSHPGLKM